MTSDTDGESVLVSLIGFGQVVNDITLTGSTIELGSADPDVLLNTAISIPQDGTITAISGYFSATQTVVIGAKNAPFVSVEVWASTGPNDTFTFLTNARVDLSPTFFGLVEAGDFATATATGLTIPVVAGTRLVLVARIRSFDDPFFPSTASLQGYISGGITIDSTPAPD